MNCTEFRNRLTDVLNRTWVPDGEAITFPPDLEEHAHQCRECAWTLEAARVLADPKECTVRAPAGLADRVADAVIRNAEMRGSDRNTVRWGRVHRAVTGFTAAALLVIATVFVTTWVLDRNGQSDMIAEEQQQPVVVRLEFNAPAADSVAVVGDWNNWDPAKHRMIDREGDGTWQIEIEIPPDREYRYQFLINGEQWVPDPSAPITVSDGFGGNNSVLNI